MGEHLHAGDLDITQQVGEGPNVLLIGGAGDTVESWQFQLDGLADRYRMTAFDNRGRAGQPCRADSAETMADDAAAVHRALDIPSAHIAGWFRGPRHLPGAGAAPSAVRPQPRPAEHLPGDPRRQVTAHLTE